MTTNHQRNNVDVDAGNKNKHTNNNQFLINVPEIDLSISDSELHSDSECEESSTSPQRTRIVIDRNYKLYSVKKSNSTNGLVDNSITVDTDFKSDNEFDMTNESVHSNHTRATNKITKVFEVGKHRQQNINSHRHSHKHHHTKEYLLSVATRPIGLHQPNEVTSTMNGHLSSKTNSQVNGVKDPVPFDYWTVPHNYPSTLKAKHIINTKYYIPPIMFSGEKSRMRKSHKNVREKADACFGNKPRLQHYLSQQQQHSNHAKHILSKITDGSKLEGKESTQNNDQPEGDLKVYFRFSPGSLSDPCTLDFMKNAELLLHFQARCRAWIARQYFVKRKKENDAVLCIQANAETWFWPWLKLKLALKPLINVHRVEEELLFYKSEVERHKALVRMLRFENAEHQARVANLLHLLEQMNTTGANNSTVQSLVKQIAEALNKNQEYWRNMASENKALQLTVLKHLQENSDNDSASRTQDQSPVSKLKRDAQFYRDQVELLREEVDEQQIRSNEHYRNQVRVLSERVEQLQHFLAVESSKVERLSMELDEQHENEMEAKGYARNLEYIVNQLSRQLEQKCKANTDREIDVKTQRDPNDKSEVATEEEDQCDVLVTYHDLLYKLEDFCHSHPELQEKLDQIQIRQLNNLESLHLSNNDSQTNSNNQQNSSHLLYQTNASSREDINDFTPRGNLTHELIELKRQMTTLQHKLMETEDQMKAEVENREELENENFDLHDRITALDRQLRHTRDEYDEIVRKELSIQRSYKDLQERLEEEIHKSSQTERMNRGLEQQLTELRDYNEPDDDLMTKEWESMKAKLRADVLFYKHSLEQLHEEYEQYRIQNDAVSMQRLLTEKEDKLNSLEKEKQQWRLEMDIQNVKLQNTTSLLDDTEVRLKMFNRERTKQMHRMSQLEAERDEAIREAANIAGRASADRELSVAKVRELEEIRIERDTLRRELNEVKQNLAGSQAENTTERRQLQARLRETELHNEARIADFKSEIERMREQIEQLQMELQTTQTVEAELRSNNQHQKWKIDELEDQISHYTRRISGLERQSVDLDAELVRTKADLTATRETVILRRSGKTRMADEWYNSLILTSETEESDMEDGKLSRGKQLHQVDSNRSINRGSKESVRTLKQRSALDLRANHKKYQSIPDLTKSRRSSGSPSHRSVKHVDKRNQALATSLHELSAQNDSDCIVDLEEED